MNGIKFPASVHLWATYYDGKGKPKWAICSDMARIKWYLYKIDQKPVKVKTGASPAEFEGEVGKI